MSVTRSGRQSNGFDVVYQLTGDTTLSSKHVILGESENKR
mgnify:CR=1 FL=1